MSHSDKYNKCEDGDPTWSFFDTPSIHPSIHDQSFQTPTMTVSSERELRIHLHWKVIKCSDPCTQSIIEYAWMIAQAHGYSLFSFLTYEEPFNTWLLVISSLSWSPSGLWSTSWWPPVLENQEAPDGSYNYLSIWLICMCLFLFQVSAAWTWQMLRATLRCHQALIQLTPVQTAPTLWRSILDMGLKFRSAISHNLQCVWFFFSCNTQMCFTWSTVMADPLSFTNKALLAWVTIFCKASKLITLEN